MKGVMFNEFTEMVEELYGDEMLDELIEENLQFLPSKGAYTSVGNYDHQEILVLVSALSDKVATPVADLVKVFGHHLAKSFSQKFPDFFSDCQDTFSFLKRIDNHIHVEVHKLYPGAELPKFDYYEIDNHQIRLIYQSNRNFSALAIGLIEATAKYYGEQISITQIDKSSGGKTHVIFDLSKNV